MLTIGGFAQIGQVSARTLRHYDDLGLLRPERVDESSGYRYYDVSQLARLHRLLALRDLGFSLEQIRDMLDDDLSTEALRGMLRLRRAQVAQVVGEEQLRLRRIEARLRSLERRDQMIVQDVVVKKTQPLRVAEAHGSAPGFGSENLQPVFAELYPRVAAHLQRAGVQPGLCIAWYDQDLDVGGAVTVHAGFGVDQQSSIPESEEVAVHEMPVIDVASVMYRGAMEDIGATYDGLMQWIDSSGYVLAGASRELYYEMCAPGGDPSSNVVEIQLPIRQ
jgi:DNA-binding transcriptional MerR regulator/predicted transcriptional regulator YdeE